MNPFHVANYPTIWVRFDKLNLPDSVDKNALKQSIVDAIRAKLNGANAYVSETEPITGYSKMVFIHNDPTLDGQICNMTDLGGSLPHAGVAEINVADVTEQMGMIGLEEVLSASDQIAAVAAHEIGHFYLPGMHSEGVDLMAPGSDIIKQIMADPDSVAFTADQIGMMNLCIENPDFYSHVESMAYANQWTLDHAMDYGMRQIQGDSNWISDLVDNNQEGAKAFFEQIPTADAISTDFWDSFEYDDAGIENIADILEAGVNPESMAEALSSLGFDPTSDGLLDSLMEMDWDWVTDALSSVFGLLTE